MAHRGRSTTLAATTMKIHAREAGSVPVIDGPGSRSRRHLSAPEAAADLWSPSTGAHYGALRLLDDVVVQPGSTASTLTVPAPEGLETIAYVLDGSCLMSHDEGAPATVAADSAVHIVGGRGARYDARNASTTAPLRMLVLAMVSPEAKPRPAFDVRAFPRRDVTLFWVATPAAEAAEGSPDGALLVGPSVHFAIARLDPGVEVRFAPAVDRGLYLVVLDGTIELDHGFLDAGGDAHFALDSHVRVQGVTAARVAIFDVQLAFVKEL
jgi:redox-sensitive bicupin YhaK (pirin superfamily)